MPNVLWEMQGQLGAKFIEVKDPHEEGRLEKRFESFEQLTPGVLTTAQFDDQVADLVNFMQWMSEPAQNQRVRLGIWVMIFLGVFTLIAWRLNAAFWRDVK
jgi:ubiquinol-cytochrome c reductase cytochrome c1 subunit